MADSTSPSKPFYKRWWFITLAVIVLIALVMPKDGERATTDTPTSSQTSSAGASDPASAPAEPEEPASQVTLANFNRVRTGMSDNEVFSILGNGEVLSESGEGEYHTIMYSWKADNGIANMNVMFQGGKVMSKAQLGLE